MRLKLTSFFLFFTLGNLIAAPLTFNTALPISKGEFILREQVVFDKANRVPSTLKRNKTAWSLFSTLVYGITPRFTLFATVPFTDRKLKSTINTRKARGIGDSKLIGRYTLHQDDFQGGTFRISPFAGVKLPTGCHKKTDRFGRLPVSIQPGTGSWDMLCGVVTTYGTVKWETDAQLSYQRKGRTHHLKGGDILRGDASLQYRLFPPELTEETLSFLHGLIEANLIVQDKDKRGAIRLPNTGGATLFLMPGLQYITERYIIEGGVQLPALQHLNGTALKKDYLARLGFRINF